MSQLEVIQPDWNAPDTIYACCTTRSGGVSQRGYSSLNLASHVADDLVNVQCNRVLLQQHLKLPTEPQWLNQTHTTEVTNLDYDSSRDTDAAITSIPSRIAVVLTADCLPVLFTNIQGTEVGAAHAGWRGLLNGVLENTLQALTSPAEEIIAWLGPAIGPQRFEVGQEVRLAFTHQDAQLDKFFIPTRSGHYLADLYSIARTRLKNIGLRHISGGQYCTFNEADRFFSYRREKDTGRQASLIYIKQ